MYVYQLLFVLGSMYAEFKMFILKHSAVLSVF